MLYKWPSVVLFVSLGLCLAVGIAFGFFIPMRHIEHSTLADGDKATDYTWAAGIFRRLRGRYAVVTKVESQEGQSRFIFYPCDYVGSIEDNGLLLFRYETPWGSNQIKVRPIGLRNKDEMRILANWASAQPTQWKVVLREYQGSGADLSARDIVGDGVIKTYIIDRMNNKAGTGGTHLQDCKELEIDRHDRMALLPQVTREWLEWVR